MQQYDANALLIGGLLFSGVAHVGSWYALQFVDVEHFTRLISEVEFAVVEEIPEPELPDLPDLPEEEEPEVEEPEPEPEPEPRRLRPPPEEAEPEVDPEPPAPAEETIVDFTGQNMEALEGGSFAMPSASGEDREGPVGRPRAQVTGRNRQGSPGGQVGGTGEGTGPAVVPMEEMSRRPAPPPNLDSMLIEYYPREARAQGVEGSSRIRIRINADGSIRVVRAISSTDQEFAQACRRMLRRTRWRPGLGPDGQPSSTFTNFNCEFTIN